jgi:nicotinate phosphoribosyltransferase
LLNTINYQTLVATRAARLRDLVGPEKRLLEFGTRRAFSPQASTWAARAALAAGFDATSNVLAAAQLGTRPAGTMAHALVMALSATEGSEAQAFRAFNQYFPHSTFLIDTYNPIAAAHTLAKLHLSDQVQIQGVRLDSGDLVTLSEQMKTILPGVNVVASGDLDETSIQALQAADAQIDAYGIGTKLVTGQPVNGVYKLVDIDGIPVMKESAGKLTYPGRKQIYRQSQAGIFQSDSLGLIDIPSAGQPLLQPVIQRGQSLQPLESLETIRQRTAANVASLPAPLRQIQSPAAAPVTLTAELLALTAKTRRDHHPNSPYGRIARIAPI